MRRFQLIREIVARRDVVVERVPFEDNITNLLTKPLTRIVFERHKGLIKIRHIDLMMNCMIRGRLKGSNGLLCEVRAIQEGMQKVLELGIQHLVVRSDSKKAHNKRIFSYKSILLLTLEVSGDLRERPAAVDLIPE
ncbi:hypothetical protein MUK42_14325 [Musa troglodytarum]|uniref:RNase H type-1 domain-containing protein n=1 Tax=Musa troglodytarum TaxID=320322 RepID=A0A9E7ICS9_9LILI|nr:hypothetical protein MUK42_14325 [Musa troglodytarum]